MAAQVCGLPSLNLKTHYHSEKDRKETQIEGQCVWSLIGNPQNCQGQQKQSLRKLMETREG